MTDERSGLRVHLHLFRWASTFPANSVETTPPIGRVLPESKERWVQGSHEKGKLPWKSVKACGRVLSHFLHTQLFVKEDERQKDCLAIEKLSSILGFYPYSGFLCAHSSDG